MTARVNLVPEVYEAHQRDKRNRRLATSIATAVIVTCLVLVGLSLVIIGGQTVTIKVLQQRIDSKETQLQTYSDLQDAVTAAQHLDSLQSLLDQKIYMTHFFTVLQTIAPQGLAVSTITVDQNDQLAMTASAKSFALAGKFAKALEAANVKVGPNAAPSQPPYFTDVHLSSVSNAENGNVSFKLTAQMANEVTSGQ